jgi:hypothetical protein
MVHTGTAATCWHCKYLVAVVAVELYALRVAGAQVVQEL